MAQSHGTRTRGYIPHLDVKGGTQYITFRLVDSLPQQVLERIASEITTLPESDRRRERIRRIEAMLDAGHGSQLLKNPVAANIVVDSLFFAHNKWCEVEAFVVMPTHVHVLMTLASEESLSETIRRIKNFTSLNIHRKLGMEPGRLWQPEYFDKLIRDREHYERTVHYIEWNPVKARLCADPRRWPYSSANDVARARFFEKTR